LETGALLMSFKMFTFVASLQYDFRELKKLLSRDCSPWLQCAGKQNNWIPKSSATSNMDMSIHSNQRPALATDDY
jgi:hypothetical protein